MRLLQLIELYSRVCKVYETKLIWHCVRHTKNARQPNFTDQELLSCYLFATGWGKARDIVSAYRYIKQHYLDWFPELPSYQAFNARLNRLAACLPHLLEYCFAQWQRQADSQFTHMLLGDSFPIITCGRKRRPKVATQWCDKGYCAMKNLYYYGVKVHLTAWEQCATLPIPAFISITAASTHDLSAQRHVLRCIEDKVFVADRAYDSKDVRQSFEKAGGRIYTPKQTRHIGCQYSHTFGLAAEKMRAATISSIRQPIETLIGWLVHHVDIQRASKVRSVKGLMVHIYGKIAATIFAQKLATTF